MGLDLEKPTYTALLCPKNLNVIVNTLYRMRRVKDKRGTINITCKIKYILCKRCLYEKRRPDNQTN